MSGQETAAWDIYAHELFPLRYGHPVWYPDPGPDDEQVNIGDVGYLRQGRFHRLFNTMGLGEGNVGGVPSSFKEFRPHSSTIRFLENAITQACLHSKNMSSTTISAVISTSLGPGPSAEAGLQYHCSKSSGALLLLRHPAHKTYMECRLHIWKYMHAHMSNWLTFANETLGIDLKEEDILFVQGHTKTSVWAETAFKQSSSGSALHVTAGCFAAPTASGEFRVSMSRSQAAMIHTREGPVNRLTVLRGGQDVTDLMRDDQNIFINYCKMKTRFGVFPTMQAAAGPHQLPDPDPTDDLGESGLSSRSTSIPYLTYDADYLLDHILKNSNALVACVTDEDVSALLNHTLLDGQLENSSNAFAPEVCVDDDGFGTIITPATSATILPQDLYAAWSQEAHYGVIDLESASFNGREVNLRDAYDGNMHALGDKRDSPAFDDIMDCVTAKITLRIQVVGVEPYARQVPAVRANRTADSISLGKLANTIAQEMKWYMDSAGPIAYGGRTLGLKDIWLTKVCRVSRSSWQPEFKIQLS